MTSNGGLQLLPEVRRSIEVKRPGENRHLIIASSFFGLVLLLTAGSFIYLNSLRDQVTSLDVVINNLENERDKKAEDNILKVKDQLRVASDLLNNHIVWSKGLTLIQNKTSSSVKYDNLEGLTEKFSFKGIAPSYSAVARQVSAYLSEDSIKDIEVSQIKSLTTGQVEFLAAIFFDKEKFLLNKK